MNVLLTGFEPFGGETFNPSWAAVRALDKETVHGASIFARLLPCCFGASGEALEALLDGIRPGVVICAGLAGGRPGISVERVAINIDDAPLPDNLGASPVDTPVVAGGPAAYFATLPVKAIVARLKQEGIPASVSQTAGTYVCNHTFYTARHLAETRFPGLRAGFIHVPYAPEQAARHDGAPSMPVSMMTKALRLAVEVTLMTGRDIASSGGATH